MSGVVIRKQDLHRSFANHIPIFRSTLTEISGGLGGGKTEFTLRLLAENPSLRVAWISSGEISPGAFEQWGIPLHRVVFIEAGKNALWSAHQLLRSQLFPILVLDPVSNSEPFSAIELRRLQLASEKAQSATILLRETPSKKDTWPISLQLEISRTSSLAASSLKVSILKSPYKYEVDHLLPAVS